MPAPAPAFATINGIPMPVNSASRLETLLIGEEMRAASGADLSSIRVTKEGWRLKFSTLPPEEAGRWRALFGPSCFSWSFDADAYSDLKGMYTTSTGITIDAANKKYGAGSAKVDANKTITYAVGLPASGLMNQRWMQMGWILRGAAWHHLILAQGFDVASVLGTGPNDVGSGLTAVAWFLNGRKLTDYSPSGAVPDAALYAWINTLKAESTPLLNYITSLNWIEIKTPNFSNWTNGLTPSGQVLARKNVRSDLGYPAGDRWFTSSTTGTGGGAEPSWNTAAIGNTTTDGTITWTYQGTTYFNVDDLVFLPLDPCPIDSFGGAVGDYGNGNGWIDYLYAFCAQWAWPPSPRFQMSGEAATWFRRSASGNVPNVLVMGKVTGSDLVRARLGYRNLAGLSTGQRTYRAAEKLEVEIREV